MTEIAAGNAQIVAEPRPPLAVLLELRRWVPTVPS
jgi:hypothetical protein